MPAEFQFAPTLTLSGSEPCDLKRLISLLPVDRSLTPARVAGPTLKEREAAALALFEQRTPARGEL